MHKEALEKEALELRGTLKRIRVDNEDDTDAKADKKTQSAGIRRSYTTDQRTKAIETNLKRWNKDGPKGIKGQDAKSSIQRSTGDSCNTSETLELKTKQLLQEKSSGKGERSQLSDY